MLLSGERTEMVAQLGHVLAGYEDFRILDLRELHLVEALRTLRLLHYSAWIARRWNDPPSPPPSPGSAPSAIGRTASWSCASRSRHGGRTLVGGLSLRRCPSTCPISRNLRSEQTETAGTKPGKSVSNILQEYMVVAII